MEDISTLISASCQIASEWMLGNKLKHNSEKTLLTEGTADRLKNQDTKVVVQMDGVVLKESTSEMLLECCVFKVAQTCRHVTF